MAIHGPGTRLGVGEGYQPSWPVHALDTAGNYKAGTTHTHNQFTPPHDMGTEPDLSTYLPTCYQSPPHSSDLCPRTGPRPDYTSSQGNGA